MELNPADGPILERPPVRLEIAVAEGGDGETRGRGNRIGAHRRPAIVAHELDDVDARGRIDQPRLSRTSKYSTCAAFARASVPDSFPRVNHFLLPRQQKTQA